MPNAQVLHLLLNHVPVVGAAWTLLLLLAALWRPVPALVRTALAFTVLVGLTAIPTFLSGEQAESLVERLPGVSEHAIGVHAEMAEKALWLALAAAVAGAGGFLWSLRRRTGRRPLVPALVLLTVAALLLAWAAHLGGKIHRPELRSGPAAAAPTPEGGGATGH